MNILFYSYTDPYDESFIQLFITQIDGHLIQIMCVNRLTWFVAVDNGPVKYFDSLKELESYYGKNQS